MTNSTHSCLLILILAVMVQVGCHQQEGTTRSNKHVQAAATELANDLAGSDGFGNDRAFDRLREKVGDAEFLAAVAVTWDSADETLNSYEVRRAIMAYSMRGDTGLSPWSPELESRIVRALSTGEPMLRIVAFNTLNRLETDAAREGLYIVLRDPDPAVREHALRAIGFWASRRQYLERYVREASGADYHSDTVALAEEMLRQIDEKTKQQSKQ